ncbi:NAD(FAD)-utilizing dehydrogenase sll0175 homolog [Vibrio maritimus]|uniref:NAD(FAD)-utilizing dehydrogenase sll0175 homolog n=1 Tax=Vibrio maritimus TaxID=990268 RepID=A0A090TDC8_9VIBR|nr:NAD(FAD)-utilizing dehydrogenase sll0175 homolog [Vibrio maritimus]
MIRLTEIKLPLDHEEGEISQAILTKLGISSDQVISFNVFKRGYDARKKTRILLIYTLDVEVKNEAALLEKFADDPHVKVTPDMEYKFVAKAPVNQTERPVVIGFGPCGLFAGLILAQMALSQLLLNVAKRFASVLKIPLVSGVSVHLTLNRTYSLAKAVRVHSPMVSSTAK